MFQIHVVTTTRAIYDAARESAKQASDHQRGWSATRGSVADAGAAAAHQTRASPGLQHA